MTARHSTPPSSGILDSWLLAFAFCCLRGRPMLCHGGTTSDAGF